MAPTVTTWEDAFNFAHDEGVRSDEAYAAGDYDVAKALLQSAQVANRLAKQLFGVA